MTRQHTFRSWGVAALRVGLVAGAAAGLGLTPGSAVAQEPVAWQLLDDGDPNPGIGFLVYDTVRQRTVRLHDGVLGGLMTWELVAEDWVRRLHLSPAPREAALACATFDAGRGVAVVFGAGPGSDETWEWDGASWTRRLPAGSPSGRYSCSVAYDSARQRVVLFGGRDPEASSLFGDTWEYDGSSWTQIVTPISPGPREGAGMAYDSDRQVVVLALGSGILRDTWEYDGQDWIRKSPPLTQSPPGRGRHGMAYDPVRQKTVVFGGTSASQTLGDTWEWDGTSWTQIFPVQAPSPRGDFRLVFDVERGTILGHGGNIIGADEYNDTWVYDGNTWMEIAISGLPAGRRSFAMAFDPRLDATVLYGGSADPPLFDLTDTWHFSGGQWVRQDGVGAASANQGFRVVFDEERSRIVGFSGTPPNGPTPLTDIHEYQGADSNWVSIPSCCPDGRFDHGWTYAPDLGGVLLFGGRLNASTPSAETWVLEGLNWTQHHPASSPEARERMGLAFHEASSLAILHGGSVVNGPFRLRGDTWRYDGQDWQLLMETSPPGLRSSHSLVYDRAREVIVLFGDGPGFEGVTWEFDGATWIARSTPFQPDPDRCWSETTYDSRRDVVMLFGGWKCRGGSTYLNDTWAYGPDPDGDGIVGGLDNCRDTANQDQANVDGDPAGDACDCAALDPGSFAPPQAVTNLSADGKTVTTVGWDDQAPLVGSGVVYDLVTGALEDLRASGNFSGATCLAADLGTPSYADDRTLVAGAGFYYLARARNACGTGSYGPSRAALDAASPCP